MATLKRRALAPVKRSIQSSLRLVGRELVHDFDANGFRLRKYEDLSRDHWAACRTILGREPHAVFDVGANVGMTSLELARYFPNAKIHAYEPTPAVFDELKSAVSHLRRVKPHRYAMGAEEGTIQFHLNRMAQTNSVLPNAAGNEDFNQSAAMQETVEIIDVPMRTVAGECKRLGLDRLDILKTDCQGYDLKVIEGAMGTPHPIPLIYAEVCFAKLYEGQPTFGQFHDRMNEMGYRMVDLYETGFRSYYYQISANALFMHEHGPRPGSSRRT